MNCSMNCKIKKIRTLFALPLIAIFFAAPFAVPLAAQDFGLLLNQYGSFGHIDGAAAGENQFEYRIGIVPRFSVNFNDNSSLFISAGVSASRSDDFDIIPELLRTEFSWSSGHLGLNIGRIPYADPLGFIANGLFDGIQFTHTSQAGRFGFGAWYTGFLFKDTANITMTQADQLLYAAPFDINNFADTYFASSRLLASISYENLAIADFMRLNAAVVGQFDLNDADETLNTQYLILRLGLPVNNVFFQLGGSLAAMQSDGSFNLAFSGEFGLYWTIPSGLGNRLSFN
ncbi:MAG: hypothetical protein FWC97_07390, partial [Treponema sp.]|nr:hypothetical protein [Treponema sp.]